MPIQLYNLEGQPMEVLPDGSPIPAGRWTTPSGGFDSRNGGWGLGAGSVNPNTGAVTPTNVPGDPYHERLTQLNNQQIPGNPSAPGVPTPPPQQTVNLPTPAAPTSAAGGGIDFQSLLAQPSAGGNFDTTQHGAQTGSYGSTGTTAQQQSGQRKENLSEVGRQTGTSEVLGSTSQQQTTQGTTAGTSTNATQGTSAQTTAGQQATTGATTAKTTVDTPFDIASLVQQQLPGQAQSDAQRTAWLQSTMRDGNPQFRQQIDEAVRGSLTGPQTTGAGDSARARMASYGVDRVARNDMNSRLAAAGMLGDTTGLTKTVGAVAPLYGKTESGTQTGVTSSTGQTQGTQAQTSTGANTSTTNQNVTGQSSTGQSTTTDQISQLAREADTMDFQSLVGNETTQGVADGSSVARAFGTAPEGQPVKTGGCVVCTAFVSMGGMPADDVRKAVLWKLSQRSKYATAVDGYMLYGPTLAKLVLDKPWFARWFRPIARAILDHELYLSSPTERKWRFIPFITHEVFDRLSRPVGFFSRLLGLDTGVRDQRVKELLIKEGLAFKL